MVLWHEDHMVFPLVGCGPHAAEDTPEHVRADYDEANSISGLSPRGSAALLRLAVQKLCKHLGQAGKTIDDDIKAMVAAGLPSQIQKALDTVRVVGNEAVHPGTLDIKDDTATVAKLFTLVNMIVHKMITEPKEIDALYQSLPENKRDAIDRRDGK